MISPKQEEGLERPSPGEAIIAASRVNTARFSRFKTCTTSKPAGVATLASIIEEIQSDKYREAIEKIRAAEDKKEMERLKLRLPCIKFAGEFSGLKAEHLVTPSGWACLDLDGVDGSADLEVIRGMCAPDHACAAASISPSGTGLKIVVPVDPAQFAAAYAEAMQHFERLLRPVLPDCARLDWQVSNIASNCFLSWDPLAYLAPPEKMLVVFAGRGGGRTHDRSAYRRNSFYVGKDRPTAPPARTPPAAPGAGFRFRDSIEQHLWPNFMAKLPHRPKTRNATIISRIPILINLVAPHIAARMLLRWYDLAPTGFFEESRAGHWVQTWRFIHDCLCSWPSRSNPPLSEREKEIYLNLPSDRAQTAFRIARSLSIARNNTGRKFYLSAREISDRLDWERRSAKSLLDLLVRLEVIEVIQPGQRWATGTKPRATVYRWRL